MSEYELNKDSYNEWCYASLEEVKAWRKKYLDDLESIVSIDDTIDYLGNYEALLVTIEEDGVAKEDFFSFDFLDDA